MITNKTQLNAVIGYPLEHTLSPVLHDRLYQDNNIDAVLLAFASQDLEALIESIRTLSIGLTAVTMPYKLAVMPYLDEIDGAAKKIGAVNTIINKSGKLCGYNTDIVGIRQAFKAIGLKNKKVLLIGAGGAARTVAGYLQQVGGLPLYLNRTKRQAEILADEFGGQVVELNDLAGEEIDAIINTTPVGLRPEINQTPIPDRLLGPRQTVMDVIYNPVETKLLKAARHKGARVIPGLEMFIQQALEQVRLWQNRDIRDGNYFNFLSRQIIN